MEAKIVKTQGVVGGKARIDGTRIRVIDVFQDYQILGHPIEKIAQDYNITAVQVLEALKYYYQHPQEIRDEIRRDKELVEKFRKEGNVIIFESA